MHKRERQGPMAVCVCMLQHSLLQRGISQRNLMIAFEVTSEILEKVGIEAAPGRGAGSQKAHNPTLSCRVNEAV